MHRCKLHRPARRSSSAWEPQGRPVFVGEAPGADEDARASPSWGARASSSPRSSRPWGCGGRTSYICNIIKCRPPNNRTPEADEIVACQPFLLKQLQAIGPKFICAPGRARDADAPPDPCPDFALARQVL